LDERFPKWLRFTVNKLSFLGIPNLGTLIVGLAVLAFFAQAYFGTPADRFLFDPEMVKQGEYWRLFAFPLPGGSNIIWNLLYLLYVYYVFNALESYWGPGPLTVFVLLGYIAGIAAAFLTSTSVSIWFHIIENVSLAFGTLFPNIEFYIYFILPVKAKWLAALAGALILVQFFLGSWTAKLTLFTVMLPYLIFFSPMLFVYLRTRRKIAENRKRFDPDQWR
jgi:hypothetical protein